MIVDDNPVNVKLVRAVLAADGYDIRTAADGPEAWSVLEQFRPRLILMDVQLPGADGFELTRRLKLDPATRDIIVLAITAYAMPGRRGKSLHGGLQRLPYEAGGYAHATGHRKAAHGNAAGGAAGD